MNLKNFTSWLFLICTLLILITQNNFIKNKYISASIFTFAIIGIIYSLYASKIDKKIKFIIAFIYLVCLVVYLLFNIFKQ